MSAVASAVPTPASKATPGIALATLVNVLYPESSFTLMMAISMFGAIFTWFMIFLTHYCFRRYHQRHGEKKLSFRMRFFPYTTLLGLVLMGAVMITTYFTDAFKMTLVFGVPFLLILSLVYALFFRKGKAGATLGAVPDEG